MKHPSYRVPWNTSSSEFKGDLHVNVNRSKANNDRRQTASRSMSRHTQIGPQTGPALSVGPSAASPVVWQARRMGCSSDSRGLRWPLYKKPRRSSDSRVLRFKGFEKPRRSRDSRKTFDFASKSRLLRFFAGSLGAAVGFQNVQ